MIVLYQKTTRETYGALKKNTPRRSGRFLTMSKGCPKLHHGSAGTRPAILHVCCGNINCRESNKHINCFRDSCIHSAKKLTYFPARKRKKKPIHTSYNDKDECDDMQCFHSSYYMIE